jgi:hypothetical protein
MELTHETSCYGCPGCLTTWQGWQLRETRSRFSLVRRTTCCDRPAVYLPDGKWPEGTRPSLSEAVS